MTTAMVDLPPTITMSQDDILKQIRTVVQSLESLQTEHCQIMSGLNESLSISKVNELVQEKISLINKSNENINLALGEARVIIALSNHLHYVESQKQKLRSQVQRLNDENAWLRDELMEFQQRWQTCQERCAALEEEKAHLQFLVEVKKFDADLQTSDVIDKDKNLSNNLDLGFPDNEEESSNQPEVMSPSQPSGPDRLRTLINLVVQYASNGRYEVAVPLCKQTINDLEKAGGHEHPDVATMLNILACVYRDQGKIKEATDLLIDALDIREKTLGSDHQAVAATLNNLAVLYGKRSRFKEAEALCKRALLIREKLLGKDHPDVAKQLNNLALICQNQGKYEEVESYYLRALEIYENSYSIDNPYYIKTKNNLVEKHYKAALEVYEKVLPRDDNSIAKTKNNLASAYLKQNKYKQAEELYKEILTRAHEREVATGGGVSGKPIWVQAEEAEETKSKICKDVINESHDHLGISKTYRIDSPTVSTTLKNLGALYRRQGKLEAAETIEGHSRIYARMVTTEKRKSLMNSSYMMNVTTPDFGADDINASQSSLDKAGENQRPSSFSKLRQSLARGGARIVQKLTGADKDRVKKSDSQDDMFEASSDSSEMQPITSLIGTDADDFIIE